MSHDGMGGAFDDGPVRILHCHSTFALGGKEARAARLMTAFGANARHVVLSGVPGALGASKAVGEGVDVSYPVDAPSLHGKPSFARYRALAQMMQRFDLILTYNWGALDAVMTRRMFPNYLPPLIHHEDGFNADEVDRMRVQRNWFRRIALSTAHALVVPSTTLETIATKVWKQPPARVLRIANGIETRRFGPTATAVIPGFQRRKGEVVIGTVAGLRAVKNLPRLVRAVFPVEGSRLVIVGDGPERDTIQETARAWHMAERVILPGFMSDPWRFMGHFDVFALSSDSEQAPLGVIEAMATGLPVVAPAVGDIANMVSPENLPFITPAGDEAALSQALTRLAGDASLRRAVGKANRVKALAEFDERVMIASYAALYEQAIDAPGVLLARA